MSDLLDLGNAPEVYCDGIAEIYVVGEVARMLMFSYKLIDGQWHKVLIMTMIRPVSTLGTAQGMVRKHAEVPSQTKSKSMH